MSSNLSTGLTVAANMIGSVTLVAPTIFHNDGILSSLFIMCFMGFVYCITCQLWSKHQRKDENDISEIVQRVLGRKWFLVLGISSGIFLLLLCVIYFLLLNKTLYPVITRLLEYGFKFTNFQKSTENIVFDKFSIQYLGIINLIILSPFFNLKTINLVLKFAKFGVIFLIIYFLTLVTTFGINLKQGGIIFSQIKLFSSNLNGFIDVAGQFSLAFISHNTIVTVTKNNASMQQNPKAIAIGYFIAGILYAMFGIFGGLSIQKTTQAPFSIIIGISIFFYITSIFGIFPYVSRMQFFCFSQNSKLSNYQFYIYNAIIMIACLVFQIVNTTPGLIIAITGTGVGFFVCFILPIYIHFKCYHPEWKQISEVQEDSMINTISLIGNSQQQYQDILIKDIEINKKKDSVMTNQQSLIQTTKAKNTECVHHPNSKKTSFKTRLVLYGIIMLIGVINFVLQIKLIFFK